MVPEQLKSLQQCFMVIKGTHKSSTIKTLKYLVTFYFFCDNILDFNFSLFFRRTKALIRNFGFLNDGEETFLEAQRP